MLGLVGFGSWGTALSIACSYNKTHIIVWVRNRKQKFFFKKFFFNINHKRNLDLNDNITITTDVTKFFNKTSIIIFAVPSFSLHTLLKKIAKKIHCHHKIVISCKGFFKGIPLHKTILSKANNNKIAILTGPSFAEEIFYKKYTAINISSNDKLLLMNLSILFHSKYFQVYTNNDVTGLQFSSIYKNILALSTGMVDNLEFGKNARAALITYGLSEYKSILPIIGGKISTSLKLGAIGDMILTCTSKKSRNYAFGYSLNKNCNIKLLTLFFLRTIESIGNVTCLLFLSKKYNMRLHIPEHIKNILLDHHSSLHSMKSILKIKNKKYFINKKKFNMIQKIKSLLYLIRINKPIGILLLLWPTVTAIFVNVKNVPLIKNIIIFVLGVFITRSMGCAINDLLDRDYDKHVTRTKNRPIAKGDLSVMESVLFIFLLCFISFILVLQLDINSVLFSPFILLIIFIYPLSKRFFDLPQLILGVSFSSSVILCYISSLSLLGTPPFFLLIATIIWALIYDTQYAMVDIKDDIKINIKSSAIFFGCFNNIFVFALQVIHITMYLVLYIDLNVYLWLFTSLLACIILILYQQYLMRLHNTNSYFQAFLNNNYYGIFLSVPVCINYFL